MIVTIGRLEEWGACEDARLRFARDYPNGLDMPVKQIAEIPMLREAPYWCLWFLHEVAARADGKDGDDAFALLVERADPSRLAKAVNEIKGRDIQPALAKLCKGTDAYALFLVAERAKGEAGHTAAIRMAQCLDEHEREAVLARLPADRADIVRRSK